MYVYESHIWSEGQKEGGREGGAEKEERKEETKSARACIESSRLIVSYEYNNKSAPFLRKRSL